MFHQVSMYLYISHPSILLLLALNQKQSSLDCYQHWRIFFAKLRVHCFDLVSEMRLALTLEVRKVEAQWANIQKWTMQWTLTDISLLSLRDYTISLLSHHNVLLLHSLLSVVHWNTKGWAFRRNSLVGDCKTDGNSNECLIIDLDSRHSDAVIWIVS